MWADPLLRYLVLWSGLLGAVLATGHGKHIALDLTGRKLSPKVRSWVTLTTHLFCVLTSAGLTWAGWIFMTNEINFGGPGPLTLPTWFWNGIFPVAFGLITIKYILLFFIQVKAVLIKDSQVRENRP
jgi:TRAP-type C4-dicarboxylate transport system permease small subunit